MHAIQHAPSSRRRQRGQGMTEYIIIVALVAIAAIGAFTFFGGTLRTHMAAAGKELSGQSSTQEMGRVQEQGNKTATEGNKDKNLGEYESDHN